jgi:hypothetical protein
MGIVTPSGLPRPKLALSSLRPGQAARVTVDALPGRTFDGKVYVIDPIVDTLARPRSDLDFEQVITKVVAGARLGRDRHWLTTPI